MAKRSEYPRQDSYGTLDADDREREAMRKIAMLQGARDQEDAAVGRLLRFIVWIAIVIIIALWRVFG